MSVNIWNFDVFFWVHQKNFQKINNKRFIQQATTKESLILHQKEVKERKIKKSSDLTRLSWSTQIAIDLAPLISCRSIKICTQNFIYDNQNQLKSTFVLAGARRHCMWAKFANKSLIMIDLRRTTPKSLIYIITTR